jgi:hypothetical protein
MGSAARNAGGGEERPERERRVWSRQEAVGLAYRWESFCWRDSLVGAVRGHDCVVCKEVLHPHATTEPIEVDHSTSRSGRACDMPGIALLQVVERYVVSVAL